MSKTFACGGPYKQLSALKGLLRPVEARATKAHTEYLAHSRVLDHKVHHAPIEAGLLEFDALGGDHAH